MNVGNLSFCQQQRHKHRPPPIPDNDEEAVEKQSSHQQQPTNFNTRSFNGAATEVVTDRDRDRAAPRRSTSL